MYGYNRFGVEQRSVCKLPRIVFGARHCFELYEFLFRARVYEHVFTMSLGWVVFDADRSSVSTFLAVPYGVVTLSCWLHPWRAMILLPSSGFSVSGVVRRVHRPGEWRGSGGRCDGVAGF